MQHKCCIGQVDVLLTCNRKKYLQYFRFCILRVEEMLSGSQPTAIIHHSSEIKDPSTGREHLGLWEAESTTFLCSLLPKAPPTPIWQAAGPASLSHGQTVVKPHRTLSLNSFIASKISCRGALPLVYVL